MRAGAAYELGTGYWDSYEEGPVKGWRARPRGLQRGCKLEGVKSANLRRLKRKRFKNDNEMKVV